jgi:hypothetical protein
MSEETKKTTKYVESAPDSGPQSFVFRNKEWKTRELWKEFSSLKEQMNSLKVAQMARRLPTPEWNELRRIQEELEYIGPELERRDREAREVGTARKMVPSRKISLAGKGHLSQKKDGFKSVPKPSGSEGLMGAEKADLDEHFKKAAANFIRVLFPEGGKKTFLDDETVTLIAELVKTKSAIHNQQEEIRKTKKTGQSVDTDGLRVLQKKRDEYIESLRTKRAEREALLLEASADERGAVESSSPTREERQRQREIFRLSNAVEELGFVIGETEREKRNDFPVAKTSLLPNILVEANPMDTKSDLTLGAPESMNGSVPLIEVSGDTERLKQQLLLILDAEIKAFSERIGRTVQREVAQGEFKELTLLEDFQAELKIQKSLIRTKSGKEKERISLKIERLKEQIRDEELIRYRLALLEAKREPLISGGADGSTEEGQQQRLSSDKLGKLAKELALSSDESEQMMAALIDPLEKKARQTATTGKKSGQRTEKEINQEVRDLLALAIENQGPIKGFETEISDLEASLARERLKLEQSNEALANGTDEFAVNHTALLEGVIVRTEAVIRRKKEELELRRHPEGIREKIDVLNQGKKDRFSSKEKKPKELGDLPPIESDVERMDRRAEELRSEQGLHEIYLERLRADRVKATDEFRALITSRSAEMKGKLDGIKGVLTGLKSGSDILAKLEAEQPVTTDNLRKIDEEIKRIEEKKKGTDEALTLVMQEIESLAKTPDTAMSTSVEPASKPDAGMTAEISEVKVESILDYESFTTARSSTYQVLPDGTVQRTKHILDDPNYRGEDKGTEKVHAPSDIILFYRPETIASSWLNDFSAIDPDANEPMSAVIDLGVYVEGEGGMYQLTRSNLGVAGKKFLLVRVRKDDPFTLKETLSSDELRAFQDRTLLSENKGIGVVLLSQSGDLTNIPTEGFNTVDYRYNGDGTISWMHNGNTVVSIVKRQEADEAIVETLDSEGKVFLVLPEELRDDAEAKQVWQAFNDAARIFSETPHSWSLPEASLVDAGSYRSNQEEFQEALVAVNVFIEKQYLSEDVKRESGLVYAAAGEVLRMQKERDVQLLQEKDATQSVASPDAEAEVRAPEDGVFLPVFEGVKGDIEMELKFDAFNKAAKEFSEVPFSWSFDDALPSNKASYEWYEEIFTGASQTIRADILNRHNDVHHGLSITDAEEGALDAVAERVIALQKQVDADRDREQASEQASIPTSGTTEPTRSLDAEPVVIMPNVSVAPENLPVSPEPVVASSGPLSLDDLEVNLLSYAVKQKLEGFGITPEDIESVDGFSYLTEGQQLFVAEMLKHAAGRKIEDASQGVARSKMSVLKSFNVAKSRKEFSGKMLHGGIEMYKDDLDALVRGIVVSGLDVSETEGKFDICFLSPVIGMENDMSTQTQREAFNTAANRFAKIPHEWSLEGASKQERERYDVAQAEYEQSRQALETALFSSERGEDASTYGRLAEEYASIRTAENRVRLVQHLQAHPEIDAYLGDMTGQNLASAFIKTTGVERGGAFAAGFALRVATAGALGILAAPVVATVLGGFRARSRAKESLVEQDRRMRQGGPASLKIAPQTRNAFVNAYTIGQTKKQTEAGEPKKLGLVEKLDNALKAVNYDLSEMGSDDSYKKLERLGSRIAYTKRKMDEGLVSYGEGAESTKSVVLLTESLMKAELMYTLASEQAVTEWQKGLDGRTRLRSDAKKESGEQPDGPVRPDSRGLQKKTEAILDIRNERIDSRRNRKVVIETVKGAVLSGVTAGLGMGVAHVIREGLPEWLPWRFGGASDVREAASSASNAGSGSGTGAASQEAVASPAVSPQDGISPRTPVDSMTVRTPSAASSLEASPVVKNGVGGGAADGVQQSAAVQGAKSVDTAGNIYTETVKSGEGATHLARRALTDYVEQNPQSASLTPEQRVYVEDYLQKKVAHTGALRSGERMQFSKEMIDEAIVKARGLNEAQIENLHQYAERVDTLKTGGSATVHSDLAGAASPSSVKPIGDPPDAFGGGRASVDDASANIAAKTDVPFESLRGNVRSAEAKDYIVNQGNADSFLETMRSVSKGLFSKDGVVGGVDERALREIGDMPSKDVFKSCFNSIADTDLVQNSTTGEAGKLRQFGRFLIAASEYGVLPEFDFGKSETFRAYMERVSVALIKNGKSPSILFNSGLTDSELERRATVAIAALGGKE